MDSSTAIQRLGNALSEIQELSQTMEPPAIFDQWYRNTTTSIIQIFGESSTHLTQFRELLEQFIGSHSAHSTENELMTQEFLAQNQDAILEVATPYTRALDSAAALLMSYIQEVENYGLSDSQSSTSSNVSRGEEMNADKVFLVHGRDDGTREKVARVIQQLGLEPVILEEQPNQGRTVIEKFEEEAQRAGFAVVLLTPDDEGRLLDDNTELTARARQNAIFELGYFAGALGRDRVCVLKKGDVELPSDIYGVMYIAMGDAGGWKLGLVRELKEAGFDVDANALIDA